MSASETLIASTANPLLERAVLEKLARYRTESGSLGELEPLATRLALIRNSLKPRLESPQLVLVAGDHGLAVEGLAAPDSPSTADQIRLLLDGRTPLSALAAAQGLALTVVDAGTADRLTARDRLLIRKIAHGTRNTRLTPAMSVDQAQAALRAGMEFGEGLPGSVVACAGMGVGADVSAALVISRLSGVQVHELLLGSSRVDASKHGRLAVLAQTALSRHREASDPIDVLAAFGGFEMAMLVGLMLSAAQQRRLVMVDGLAACAALLVASRIAEAVTDYCLFCRSQRHLGLDTATRLFHSNPVLELALDSTDGCGAAMSWPLVRASAALLTDIVDSATGSVSLLSLDHAEPTEQRSPSRSPGPIDDAASAEDRSAWHSPFNQVDQDNVSAASNIDTQRDPTLGSNQR